MSVNLVNGDTLNSDFTAICNKIRAKTGDSNTISYTVGHPENIVNAIDSISGGGGGGGGFAPEFSMTELCDNTSLSTGTLTFTDDYDNYDFLVFEIYNTSSDKTSFIVTIPELLNHIIAISTYINFNEWCNNQYGCYSVSNDHLTWSVYARRNLVIKTVTGLNCTNATVTKTTFYERANRTVGAVTVEPVEDLATYDYLFFSSTTGGIDETQPCFPPVYVDKNLFEETPEYKGAFFIYNSTTYINSSLARIGHHSIVTGTNSYYDNRYLVGAYGVKFEHAVVEVFRPKFNTTLLASDTSDTGTLDFNGADYHDYPLLKVVGYDSIEQKTFNQLVVPDSIDVVFNTFSRGACFGRYKSSRFAYYSPDSSGNWIRGNSDNFTIKKVYGIEGANCDITVTNLYTGSSTSAINQTIPSSASLSIYDCFVATANVSYSDCEPCCYTMAGYGENTPKESFANLANSWNSGDEVVFSEHEISSYYWFTVDAVKFTAKTVPEFAETLICDNTALSEGNLTFSDSYTKYDFLRFEIYNPNNQTTFYLSTLPEIITNIRTRGSGYVTLPTSSVSWSSARYTVSNSDDKQWTRITSQPFIIKAVYGISCVNKTVVKDTIYTRANSSSSSVTIEPSQSLWEYSSIYFSSVNDSYQENMPCQSVIDIGTQSKINPNGFYFLPENLLSGSIRSVYIYEHSITNNNYLGDVIAVKLL